MFRPTGTGESGHAKLADKVGYLTMFKAYMDESGIHDGSPILTVAAYVGLSSTWRDWTKKWDRQKRPINVFHSTDCANLRGEFKDWDSVKRDEFVANLLPVIGNANILAVVAGILMDDYREVAERYPAIEQLLGTPYTACFQWVVQGILDGMKKAGVARRVAFIHENNQWKGEALDCFDYIKKHLNPDNLDLSLSHGDKSAYTPLQAADVLAYEANKRLRDFNKHDRRAWEAINPDSDRRQMRYFDKTTMISLMQDFEKRPEFTHFFDSSSGQYS